MIEVCHCEQSDFVRKRRGRPKLKNKVSRNSNSYRKQSNNYSKSLAVKNEKTNVKITLFEEAYNYINKGERHQKNSNLNNIKKTKRKRKRNTKDIKKKTIISKTNNRSKNKQNISNKRDCKTEEGEFKKIVKKTSSLFDIDNFVINSNNSAKFFETEKKNLVNIPVPKYSLLSNKFYKPHGNPFSDEDITDEYYKNLHCKEEEKEKEVRENCYKKKNNNKPYRNESTNSNINGQKKINN